MLQSLIYKKKKANTMRRRRHNSRLVHFFCKFFWQRKPFKIPRIFYLNFANEKEK